MASLDAGALVGGTVLTERLFRWPGLGSLAVEGLLARDVAVLSSVVVVAALGVSVANTCGELVTRAFDPRLREEPRTK
jgi:peptide/nickel transport system permease protein